MSYQHHLDHKHTKFILYHPTMHNRSTWYKTNTEQSQHCDLLFHITMSKWATAHSGPHVTCRLWAVGANQHSSWRKCKFIQHTVNLTAKNYLLVSCRNGHYQKCKKPWGSDSHGSVSVFQVTISFSVYWSVFQSHFGICCQFFHNIAISVLYFRYLTLHQSATCRS